jgi:hypothetical protein
MKLAVITPFYRTPQAWLKQCLASVARQTAPASHFLVCDGDEPAAGTVPANVEILRLPKPHRDFGNVARAIGAVSAIGQGFDAIVFQITASDTPWGTMPGLLGVGLRANSTVEQVAWSDAFDLYLVWQMPAGAGPRLGPALPGNATVIYTLAIHPWSDAFQAWSNVANGWANILDPATGVQAASNFSVSHVVPIVDGPTANRSMTIRA